MRELLNNKSVFWFLLVAIFVLAIVGTYAWQQDQVNKLNIQIIDLNRQLSKIKNTNEKTQTTPITDTYSSPKSVEVKLYTPQKNAKVSSPLVIMGQIPGNWSFEAGFPVKLINSEGKVIAQAPAQVIGDWMTDKLVPFSVQLTWSSGESGDGMLILQKDNPSGLSENNDSVSIPIKF